MSVHHDEQQAVLWSILARRTEHARKHNRPGAQISEHGVATQFWQNTNTTWLYWTKNTIFVLRWEKEEREALPLHRFLPQLMNGCRNDPTTSQVFFRESEARKVEWTVTVLGCQVRRTLQGLLSAEIFANRSRTFVTTCKFRILSTETNKNLFNNF